MVLALVAHKVLSYRLASLFHVSHRYRSHGAQRRAICAIHWQPCTGHFFLHGQPRKREF